MATRADLPQYVIEALDVLGGRGTVLDVSKVVWARHEDDLRSSGDLFYTWQYDLRWAAQKLRNTGILEKVDGDRSGVWTIARS
ncbi:hypothetical protein QE370_002911 [Aeromicrobium sp. SORGH_AS981]|uniref:hypothetical protein n=1 Tax=Aeromicrobium sp. SORGH_AS_0981 TaxID=3041802 RepID=UPI002855CB32|nr:hypothetical protein [Aeromicrobium sp. SORGH_AS_0981]MDR6119727.1 hypothetical protein [Aeromicrobium sp. SORGH_AS_0981]